MTSIEELLNKPRIKVKNKSLENLNNKFNQTEELFKLNNKINTNNKSIEKIKEYKKIYDDINNNTNKLKILSNELNSITGFKLNGYHTNLKNKCDINYKKINDKFNSIKNKHLINNENYQNLLKNSNFSLGSIEKMFISNIYHSNQIKDELNYLTIEDFISEDLYNNILISNKMTSLEEKNGYTADEIEKIYNEYSKKNNDDFATKFTKFTNKIFLKIKEILLKIITRIKIFFKHVQQIYFNGIIKKMFEFIKNNDDFKKKILFFMEEIETGLIEDPELNEIVPFTEFMSNIDIIHEKRSIFFKEHNDDLSKILNDVKTYLINMKKEYIKKEHYNDFQSDEIIKTIRINLLKFRNSLISNIRLEDSVKTEFTNADYEKINSANLAFNLLFNKNRSDGKEKMKFSTYLFDYEDIIDMVVQCDKSKTFKKINDFVNEYKSSKPLYPSTTLIEILDLLNQNYYNMNDKTENENKLKYEFRSAIVELNSCTVLQTLFSLDLCNYSFMYYSKLCKYLINIYNNK